MRRIKIGNGWRLAAGALQLAAVLSLMAGCGGAKDPPRFDISGKVTYGGAPVPRGLAIFAPDKVKDNDGPWASAAIVDGNYKTLPGKGTIGGPHVVTIDGFDGIPSKEKVPRRRDAMGKHLFRVQLNVNLPREAATHDFVIPERTKE